MLAAYGQLRKVLTYRTTFHGQVVAAQSNSWYISLGKGSRLRLLSAPSHIPSASNARRLDSFLDYFSLTRTTSRQASYLRNSLQQACLRRRQSWRHTSGAGLGCNAFWLSYSCNTARASTCQAMQVPRSGGQLGPYRPVAECSKRPHGLLSWWLISSADQTGYRKVRRLSLLRTVPPSLP